MSKLSDKISVESYMIRNAVSIVSGKAEEIP